MVSPPYASLSNIIIDDYLNLKNGADSNAVDLQSQVVGSWAPL
jgi:hypothetical protein